MNTADPTVLLLGHAGSWWDLWMLVSLGTVALAGVAVLFFTAGSVMVHKREALASDNELKRYQAETAGKVADATAAGIAAGEKAGHAQADIDAAKVALAKQQTLTANAQLETERLKAQLAWRVITPEQEVKFLSSLPPLKLAGITVYMNSIGGDAEGAKYAADLAQLLQKAGASVPGPGASMFVGPLPEGVILSVQKADSTPGRAGALLQHAFKAAGIDAPGQVSPSVPDDQLQMIVGIKPHQQPAKPREGRPNESGRP
jgi:hypothetical protein